MDITLETKINVFSGLSFDEAANIILTLCRELTQREDDIYAHIVRTLPSLSEKELEKNVLVDIYREIMQANEAVTDEEREKALQSLNFQHARIQTMLEREKVEKSEEIAGLNLNFSIL